MKLVRLFVERFGSVRRARLEFGPGLNVLYGPNDLGKSTLAEAIRAALLLPPGSSAHEDFVEWGTDETPKVELVFQTEPDERYWRIKKEFGCGSDAKATLASSADGRTWVQEAKGRKVDGEVRRLLSWGIPEPGGRGGTRGLPQSFLTSVLLARQVDPAAIFKQSIDEDADTSGKKLLTHALQALAQDPLLKKALDAAQRRMDEAYTSTGQRKRGRGAPFKEASDAIRLAIAEHESRLEDLTKTREVEARIKVLIDERLFAEQARDEAALEMRQLEQAFKRQAARRELEERLHKAQQALADIELARQRVVEGESDEQRRREELEQAEARVAKIAEQKAAGDKRLSAAQEELRRLSSGDAAREQELARRTLEKELLELSAKKVQASGVAEQARAAGQAAQAVEAFREKLVGLEEHLAGLQEEIRTLESSKETADALREQLAGVAVYEQWLKATADAKEAKAARGEARKLLARISRMEQDATGTSGARGQRTLPSADELKKVRRLHEQRIEADARLGVGLSVQVRVKKPLNIKATLDGGAPKLHRAVKQRRSFEAEGELSLELGSLAEIDVSGGAADAREKAEKLRARWEKVAAPLLEAAGVRSLAKLEEACRVAEAARHATSDQRREIEKLRTQATHLENLGSKVQSFAATAKAREAALEPYDRDALETLSERLGPDRDADVERLRREAQDQASQTDRRRDECVRALADHEGDLKAMQAERARAEARRDQALEALAGRPWETALEQASARVTEIEARHAAAAERLQALTTRKDGAAGKAERMVQDIEQELEHSAAAIAAKVETKEAALQALADARAEVKARRQRAEALDLEGAQEVVAELAAELDQLEAPEEVVAEQDLANARDHLDLATRAARERMDEIKKQEGALELVGGDVAKEREKMAAEAMARAKEREAELDLDYGAWRLLLETLREVESEESVHLGQALIDPISQRFRQLTEGRYGSIDIEPGLRTRGIQAGGETRELAALSAGLRDQLATLFRLSVAEHLESLLVLDDQLVQTDPRRVDWFGEVLRGCAERIQIVVLTCRPREFLAEGEMASAGAPVRASASGLLRAIDLAQRVDRAPLDAAKRQTLFD